ncbi:MAG: hypothetical protein ACOZF2_08360 [Thermodesulfobacteriota bacterium]
MITSSLKLLILPETIQKIKGPGSNFLPLAWLWPTFLVFLWLSALLSPAASRELSPQEEAALYSLADLEPGDQATKTVVVETFIAPGPETSACRRMMPLVWTRVQAFYARLGVNLVIQDGGPEPGPLAPARHLRVEMLTHKQWLARSFKAFEVAPPFRLRFLQVCRDKCAFAHLPLSVIHVSFQSFQEAESRPQPRKDDQSNRDWLANLLIHEIGHLLGLYHAHEFVNDPVAEYLPDGKTANFMSHEIAFKSELGWVDFQKRMIHSYLGQGKVYQQYAQVNFDPLRYLELIKKHNGYREPKSGKKGRLQNKTGKAGNSGTYDHDQENAGD